MAIDSKNLLVWVKSMSRGQALPLDATEVYSSVEEADAYAKTSAIAYAGQTVKALGEDGKYHTYTLQPADEGYNLEEVERSGGSTVSGDTVNLTAVMDDGSEVTLTLYGNGVESNGEST